MTRNLSISLWFGSYITSYFAWHTCFPNPVTDWKSLISTDRLHLVLCINTCLNLPKAWVLCCIPGTVSALKSVWHLAESLPQSHGLLKALHSLRPPCSEVGEMWQKTTGSSLHRTHIWGRGETRYKEQDFTCAMWRRYCPAWKVVESQGKTSTREKRPLPKVFN